MGLNKTSSGIDKTTGFRIIQMKLEKIEKQIPVINENDRFILT
jgi:hypothetical protein